MSIALVTKGACVIKTGALFKTLTKRAAASQGDVRLKPDLRHGDVRLKADDRALTSFLAGRCYRHCGLCGRLAASRAGAFVASICASHFSGRIFFSLYLNDLHRRALLRIDQKADGLSHIIYMDRCALEDRRR
jgi:hypothetical protein